MVNLTAICRKLGRRVFLAEVGEGAIVIHENGAYIVFHDISDQRLDVFRGTIASRHENNNIFFCPGGTEIFDSASIYYVDEGHGHITVVGVITEDSIEIEGHTDALELRLRYSLARRAMSHEEVVSTAKRIFEVASDYGFCNMILPSYILLLYDCVVTAYAVTYDVKTNLHLGNLPIAGPTIATMITEDEVTGQRKRLRVSAGKYALAKCEVICEGGGMIYIKSVTGYNPGSVFISLAKV